jgi:uncharacterized protein YcbK (DUF882 family)
LHLRHVFPVIPDILIFNHTGGSSSRETTRINTNQHMWLSMRVREIGQFFNSDREGILGISPVDRVLNWHSVAMFALAIPALLASSVGAIAAEERTIAFYNIHTKDNISIVYKRDGKYVPEALKKLNHFMRDWRRNITIEMDPKLVDLIWEMHEELGSKKPVHLICGHRSEKTNSTLRRTRGGQAKGSKHITGQAADIHFPDISAKQLRNSALIRERGGVGYYPTSAIPFVHVDTGRVRAWPRVPRQELAILFPSGHTKHIPADGKPITKKDFQIALANLQQKGGELPIGVKNKLRGGGNAGQVILASLTEPTEPAPQQAPAAPLQAREAKPQLTFASLTPFPGMGSGAPVRKAEPAEPLVQARTQQTAAKPDAEAFKREFLGEKPAEESVSDEDVAASPEYDEDHPDEESYQPFPVLPFMSDTPVAGMDMTTGAAELELAKVHVMFAEPREMLNTQFQPGLQFAQMFWAQRFQGTAINTALRRLDRDDAADEPVQTAQNMRPDRR